MLWWLQINLPAVVSYPISSLVLWYFQSSNTPRRDDTVLSSTSTQRHRSTWVLLRSVAEIIHPCQLGINVKVQTVVGRLSVPQTRVTVPNCNFTFALLHTIQNISQWSYQRWLVPMNLEVIITHFALCISFHLPSSLYPSFFFFNNPISKKGSCLNCK